MSQVDGLLVVDKPAGCTSHDVVSRCRYLFGQKRIGHAGTLDPDATGVLVLGLGQATRLLQFFTGLAKHYRGEVVLGTATSTLDSSGEVTAICDMAAVTVEAAREAALKMTGNIYQVPPMVSALHANGRRLHELAREGIEVERAARRVRVERFEVLSSAEGARGPVLSIDVVCSGGTYVRSLAADLGQALGGCAHLRALRRAGVGPFDEPVPLSVLEELGPGASAKVLPPAQALEKAGIALIEIREELAPQVRNGRVLSLHELYGAAGPGPWALVERRDGPLLAVYQTHRDDQVKPAVVLPGTA